LELHIWGQFWIRELEIVGKDTKEMRWIFTPAWEAEVNFSNATMAIGLEEVCQAPL
jgi:hypothetical protein